MKITALIIVTAGLAAGALGQSLFVSQPDTGYNALYGNARWTETTGYIDSTFSSVTLGGDISDLGDLLTYDRLWLDQRINTALSNDEVNNLHAFAATGRRVVIIGENSTWTNWNTSFLGAFGGSVAGDAGGLTNVILNNDITDGVTSVDIISGSAANGGTALFDQNFATLWGNSDNVLTVLDSNLWDDGFLGNADNRLFSQNAINWLAVPAPSGLALLGLGGIAAVRRRR
jgi:hypothetical protein